MKNLLILAVLLAAVALASNCSECGLGNKPRGSVPGPPYGTPDDVSDYANGEYYSKTYTYYCYNEHYRAITFTSLDKCTAWDRSDYTSECIDLAKRNAIKDLTPEERQEVLLNAQTPQEKP